MIKVLGERILVKKLEIQQKKGTLILTTEEQKDYNISEVIAVGDKVTCLQPGNIVWHARYSGIEVGYKGVEYVTLQTGEVVAFVDSKDDV